MKVPEWLKRRRPRRAKRRTGGWPDITVPTLPPAGPSMFQDPQGDGSPTEMDVALHAAARLRSWRAKAGDNAFLESVEVVSIDGSVGLDVKWTQVATDEEERRFGLLTTVDDLLRDADTRDKEWAAEALLIALVEPHASPGEDMRTIFQHLP